MFDSEKYNPSCTVNFETIRGDFQYVEKKKKNRGTLQTHAFILSLSICFSFLFFFGYSALFSQLGFDGERNLRCGFLHSRT